MARYSRSVHAAARVGCADCHGGDPEAQLGGRAHATFAGHPAPVEVAEFCGHCHRAALDAYRPSGHARLQGAKPAGTCIDCHGSHDVGNPPASFRLAEYCRSCHGLEYLPRLPQPLLDLVEADDRLTAALARRLGRFTATDDRAEARALQRHLGELVHGASLEVPRGEVETWVRRMQNLAARLER